MWSNYRPVGSMWPATVFSVKHSGKTSNLIFVEKHVRSHLHKMHIHKSNTLSVYHFVSYIYFVIKSEGFQSSTNPLTR